MLCFFHTSASRILHFIASHFISFQAKKLFMTDDGNIEPWQRLIAGSMAGIASQSSIYPMEVGYLSSLGNIKNSFSV